MARDKKITESELEKIMSEKLAAKAASADKEQKEEILETEAEVAEEEVNKKIEAARKQEKDKLYKEITDLKSSVESLTELAQAERQAKEDAENKADGIAEKERQKSLSTEEKLAEKLNTLEERLVKEGEERQILKQELQKAELTRELESYRTLVLNEAGDEIIPELVTGNSKEDIDRNVAVAKAKYEQLFQAAFNKAKGERQASVTGNMPGPTNPDPDAMDEEDLARTMATTDPAKRAKNEVSEDYLKQRDTLLDQVARAYKNQA